jgi:hypothetical protein
MFAHANTILLYGKLFEEPQSFEIVMYNHFTFYGRFTLHFVKDAWGSAGTLHSILTLYLDFSMESFLSLRNIPYIYLYQKTS